MVTCLMLTILISTSFLVGAGKVALNEKEYSESSKTILTQANIPALSQSIMSAKDAEDSPFTLSKTRLQKKPLVLYSGLVRSFVVSGQDYIVTQE